MAAFDVARASPEVREVLSRWFEFEEDGSGACVARTEEETDWTRLAGAETGAETTAHLYSMEQIGSCVLAAGSIRTVSNGGLAEATTWWLFEGFRGGRFSRIERYVSAAEALAAAEAHGQ
jgi:hypothetical protein